MNLTEFVSISSFAIPLPSPSTPQGNILVDKSGRARLNNFRFTGIAGLHCTKTSASVSRGKYRWMAPELLAAEQVHATSQSDVFAMGMVAIEVTSSYSMFWSPLNNLTRSDLHGRSAVP